MQIKEIHITNFKVFQGKHVISFPSNKEPLVFVGVNGAGKTTILEAIVGSFWEYYHKIQNKRIPSNPLFKPFDINNKSFENAKVNTVFSSQGKNIKVGFEIRPTSDPEFLLLSDDKLKDFIDSMKSDVGFYKNEARVPILAYYPVERLVRDPSLNFSIYKDENQFSSYENAFKSKLDFHDFFEWFRTIEDQENEIRLIKDSSFSDPRLHLVRKAILTFLEGFTRIRVKRIETVTLVLEKGEQEYEINQLSHGEKALIALVGDLARRLVTANQGTLNPLAGEGIVMIDELDLHLHPKWQRTILQKLKQTFPNIQFICTTHSTILLNHLQVNSIYLLEDGKCISLKSKYDNFNSYGATIEEILKIVQGAEKIIPDKIYQLLEELNESIRINDSEKSNVLIDELKTIAGSNHSGLREIQMKLKYKKLLG